MGTLTDADITKSAAVTAPSGTYEVGIHVVFIGKDKSSKQTTVKYTPYLRNISYTELRYRHWWNIHYAKDWCWIPEADNRLILPNDDSGVPNVVKNGKGYMQKNTWYQWGPTCELTFDNNGSEHNVGVYLNCEATTPRNCPGGSGNNAYLWCSFTLPTYTVAAPAPTGLDKSHFDESSRKMCYHWDVADCSYVTVERNMYKEDSTTYSAGTGFFTLNGTEKLYNSQVEKELVNEIIPDTVATVQFRVCNVSSTGDKSYSDWIDVDLPTNCKVWINVPGVGWKKAVPWVKDENGKWHKATKTYVKDNGTWKRTIM